MRFTGSSKPGNLHPACFTAPRWVQELPSPTAMEAVAESWRPYRSLGTYFMWKVDVPRSSPGKSKKAKKKET